MKETLIRFGFAILFAFLVAINYQNFVAPPDPGLWDRVTGDDEVMVAYHTWSTIAVTAIGFAVGLLLTPAASIGALVGASIALVSYGHSNAFMLFVFTGVGAALTALIYECGSAMWQSLKATAEVVRERRKIKAEQAAAKIVAAAAVAAAAPVAATPVAAVPVNRPTKRNRGKTHRVKPESLAKSGTGQKVVAQ